MIRVATINDADTIIKNNIDLAKETENLDLNYNIVSKGVNNLIRDPSKGSYFVYELNNKVVGQLMITYEWSDWRNSFFVWIQSVYVIPEFRGQGIYKALYNYVNKFTSEHNYCGIRLYVEKMNHQAQEVYQKLGMSESYYLLYEQKNEGE